MEANQPMNSKETAEDVIKRHMESVALKEGVTSDKFNKDWEIGKEEDPEVLHIILSAMTEYRSIGEREAREQVINELVGWMEKEAAYISENDCTEDKHWAMGIKWVIDHAKSLLNQQGEETEEDKIKRISSDESKHGNRMWE